MKKEVLFKWSLKFAGCVVLLILFSFEGVAKQIPTVNQIMQTSAYTIANAKVVGSLSTAQAFPAPGSLDYDINNTVALKYDLATDTFFLNKTTLEVKVSVTWWNATSSTPIGT